MGKGATIARKKYFQSGKPELFLEDLQEAIPVVRQYRHLGAVIDPEMKLGAERRHRTALANAAYDSARDLLLQNRDLQMPTRAAIFQSAVVSTYFNLSLWVAQGSEWEKMSSAFSRIVRRLLSKQIDGPSLFRVPLPLIHWATGCWPLELFARRSRISAVISLARAAPPVLWAAIQNADKWKEQLCKDLQWLVEGESGSWPQISGAGWPHWCHLLRQSPDRVRRRARKRNQQDFVAYLVAEAGYICLWTLYRSVARPGQVEQEKCFTCFMCNRDFKNRAGLGAHHYKTHGRRAAYRQCVIGTFCRACSTEYWSTARLEDHLRASPTCAGQLRQRGLTTAEVPAGYGSRRRRQQEVEQYTPAPPQTTGDAPVRLSQPVWDTWQKNFYAAVCQLLQDVGCEESHSVFLQLQGALRSQPLFEEEVIEVLDAVVVEAAELQRDPDLRPWTDAQYAVVGETIASMRNFVVEASRRRTETSTDAMSRVSFRNAVKDFDWESIVTKRPSDYVTQSRPLFILAEGWEAVWPSDRGELLSTAVVKDPMLLLPEAFETGLGCFLKRRTPAAQSTDDLLATSTLGPFQGISGGQCNP